MLQDLLVYRHGALLFDLQGSAYSSESRKVLRSNAKVIYQGRRPS
jgi:hypothetical protein